MRRILSRQSAHGAAPERRFFTFDVPSAQDRRRQRFSDADSPFQQVHQFIRTAKSRNSTTGVGGATAASNSDRFQGGAPRQQPERSRAPGFRRQTPDSEGDRSQAMSNTEQIPEHPFQAFAKPFFEAMKNLGDSGPLKIFEGENHATVDIDIPSGVTVRNPSVETVPSFGRIVVRADLVLKHPALTPEGKEKEKEPDLGENLKTLLKNFGVQLEAMDFTPKGDGSVVRQLRRTVHVDPEVFDVQGAKPFIDDGALRIYIPKHSAKRVSGTHTPPEENINQSRSSFTPSAAAASAQYQQPKPTHFSVETPDTMSTSASRDTTAPPQTTTSTTQSERPTATSTSTPTPTISDLFGPNLERFLSREAEKPSASVSNSTSSSPTPTTTNETSSGAEITSRNFAWPPVLRASEDTPKHTRWDCTLPEGVKEEQISVEHHPTKGLEIVVQHERVISTEMSEDVQNFRYTQWLPLPESVDVDAVEVTFEPNERTLSLVVPKPQAKSTKVRLSINKRT